MTTTTNKGYTLPTVGGDFGTWGTELNGNLGIQDTNLGGVVSVSVAGSADVTANTAQAQNLVQLLTGALTGNIHYILPAAGGFYIIDNQSSGAFTVTVITSAGGSTGVVAPQGAKYAVYSDGTNVYPFTGTTAGGLVIPGTITAANGTSGTQVVNFSQFNPTASASWVLHEPGGITRQGGAGVTPGGGSVAVVFQYTFSGTPWSILTNAVNSTAIVITQVAASPAAAATGFTLDANSNSTGPIATNFYWEATGPT